jgi:hypothetical protein
MRIERTADPSAALGMTKGRTVLRAEIGYWLREPQFHCDTDTGALRQI